MFSMSPKNGHLTGFDINLRFSIDTFTVEVQEDTFPFLKHKSLSNKHSKKLNY